MINYYFLNFTDKSFTGYWDGRPYTFKPGVKKQYEKGIAEHFAKHLANQVLTEAGKETYTSPKKPEEVPAFMEVFNQALLTEEIPDEDNLDIQGRDEQEDISMNITTEPRKPVDPYDANSQPEQGPGGKPQVISPEVDTTDEGDGYETPTEEPKVAPKPPDPVQPKVPGKDEAPQVKEDNKPQ